MKKSIVLLGGVLLFVSAAAQVPQLRMEQYQQLKESGNLPAQFELLRPTLPTVTPKPLAGAPKGGGNSACDCWIQPDATYTLAMTPNDDGSSAPIAIPFQFNLYSDLYSLLYINNNGNVSFDSPWATFTASPFPTASFAMVAPFWGDVDTRGDDGNGLNGGQVWYKVTPTALYVNWDEVGYFNSYTDKHNSFQLIITNGNDPVIGIGNNVSFCYKEMEWTTGDASGGTNGFGGFPSTVGANRGNGVDFIQFGTFDQPGGAYDGPFGNADGIDWLDFKNFTFNTAVSTQNIPPIASSQFLCDTIVVCVGEQIDFDISFIAPELNQTVNATSTAPSLSTYTEVSNSSPAISADIVGQFTPQPGEVGFHTIAFSATDNGVPPLTTSVNIVVEVVPAPSSPPVISGPSEACPGDVVTLTASGTFNDFTWSNGFVGTTVQVGPGIYTVTGGTGSCPLTSEPFEVAALPSPSPVITGVLFNCGGEPTTLSTTETYASYLWSNGSNDPSITVGTGAYAVTVTNADGCSSTSATVNVLSAPDPNAFFTLDPPSPGVPGTTVTFTDGSSGNGGTIVTYSWDFGDGGTSSQQDPDHTFQLPGNYVVTLTVTTADGCTSTFSLPYTIAPVDIFVPNVFSPNNDNVNDELVFTNLEFYPGSRLVVYSRWGNVVYESNSYQNNWRANDVSDGTYFYVLTLKDGREYSGHVTLLR